ncbi:MAG: hypothetical protein IJX68_01980 [Rikenellaceae bacterium]|nr:hypothetical protein [Rikenellaceae bacterium]
MSRAYIYKGETATLRFVALSSGRPMAITDDITIEMELRTTAMGRVLTKNSADGDFDLAKADQGILLCTLSAGETRQLTPGRATIGISIKRGENAFMGATSEIDILRPLAVASHRNNRLIPMDIVISDAAVQVVLDFVGSTDPELKTINGESLNGKGNINTHVYSVATEDEMNKLNADDGDLCVVQAHYVQNEISAANMEASAEVSGSGIISLTTEVKGFKLLAKTAPITGVSSEIDFIIDGDKSIMRFSTSSFSEGVGGHIKNEAIYDATLEDINAKIAEVLAEYQGVKFWVVFEGCQTVQFPAVFIGDPIWKELALYTYNDHHWIGQAMINKADSFEELATINATSGSIGIINGHKTTAEMSLAELESRYTGIVGAYAETTLQLEIESLVLDRKYQHYNVGTGFSIRSGDDEIVTYHTWNDNLSIYVTDNGNLWNSSLEKINSLISAALSKYKGQKLTLTLLNCNYFDFPASIRFIDETLPTFAQCINGVWQTVSLPYCTLSLSNLPSGPDGSIGVVLNEEEQTAELYLRSAGKWSNIQSYNRQESADVIRIEGESVVSGGDVLLRAFTDKSYPNVLMVSYGNPSAYIQDPGMYMVHRVVILDSQEAGDTVLYASGVAGDILNTGVLARQSFGIEFGIPRDGSRIYANVQAGPFVACSTPDYPAIMEVSFIRSNGVLINADVDSTPRNLMPPINGELSYYPRFASVRIWDQDTATNYIDGLLAVRVGEDTYRTLGTREHSGYLSFSVGFEEIYGEQWYRVASWEGGISSEDTASRPRVYEDGNVAIIRIPGDVQDSGFSPYEIAGLIPFSLLGEVDFSSDDFYTNGWIWESQSLRPLSEIYIEYTEEGYIQGGLPIYINDILLNNFKINSLTNDRKETGAIRLKMDAGIGVSGMYEQSNTTYVVASIQAMSINDAIKRIKVGSQSLTSSSQIRISGALKVYGR